MDKAKKLQDLKNKLQKQDLPLKEVAANLVFGDGNPDSAVIFIGEAPGANEDLQGKPFVGRAGKLLDWLLQSIGQKREDIYITNVVKYRPPQNRPPKPSEIEVFAPFLKEEIQIVNPKIIVPLGRFAMEKFLLKQQISKVHGKVVKINWQGMDLQVVPMYHPAAALRSPAVRIQLEQDFEQIRRLLRSKG